MACASPLVLLKRSQISAPTGFTWAQEDQNWTDIETFVNNLCSQIAALQGQIASTGDFKLRSIQDSQTGWLYADGSAVSRSTYAALFSLFGTSWGAGNGTTTFNIPDFRGRIPVGNGTGTGLTNRVIATYIGAETQNLNHTHTITVNISTIGNTNLSGTTGTALSVYAPSGTLTMVDFTPTGTIDPIIPAGTITMDSYRPGGTIAAITPVGSISPVNFTVNFSNATGTIQEAAPGHTHDVTIPAMIQQYAEAPGNIPAAPGTYTTDTYRVSIDLAGQVGGTQNLATTPTFTGSPVTPIFTGDPDILTGTFSGNSVTPVFHGAATPVTGIFTGDSVDLEHDHSVSLTLNGSDINHTHTASASTVTLTANLMQPGAVVAYYIKT